MVQIVRSDYLVLDSLIVHFDCMIGIVAPKNEKILNIMLLGFTPAHLKTCLLNLVPTLEGLCVEHIKYFFIIDLEE